jgi:NADPH2:quinone reductase
VRALVCKQYGSPQELVLEDRDDPVPGPGEVLIDVAAAGINFPDLLMIAGKYQVKTPPPFIPGNELAGTVSGLGEGVTQFKVGDQVMAVAYGGAFAEKLVVNTRTVVPIPQQLDFVRSAGFLINYSTSYHALKQSAQIQSGETLLVLGAAGGVGITAVEIGKALGARVIAAASSDAKLEFAKQAGADDLINYTDQSLRDAIRDITDDKGVDVVYDPVGGDLAQQALRGLAWHGRFLVVGFASGDIPKFPANLALLKEASIVGVWFGTWSDKNPQEQVQNLEEIFKLVASGKLAPRVTESYALEHYVQAFNAIAERRALGKVVLTMG